MMFVSRNTWVILAPKDHGVQQDGATFSEVH